MSRKDDEKNIYTVVERFSFKKILRYRFFLLLLFFIFTGLASYLILTGEARKLSGGRKYSDLNSEKTFLARFNLIEKIKYAYSLLTEKEAVVKKDEMTDDLDEKDAEGSENEWIDAQGESKGSTSKQTHPSNSNSQQSNGSFISHKNLMSQRLDSSLTSISESISGGVSKTSLSPFETSNSPNVKIKNLENKVGISYGKKTDGDKTAIGLLRSTFKTTIMAAKDASNDTARAWTARAFDSSPHINQTIQYDEKLRASLDRINPNSIPAFLKDPSLDAENMKSLKAPEVAGLSKEEDENTDDKEKNNKYKDLLSSLSNINPLFDIKGTNKDKTEEEIDKESYSVDPKDPTTATTPQGDIIAQADNPPALGDGTSSVYIDDYGYIRVTMPNGDVHIFHPETGKILGCESPNAGISLLPGAEGCPADVYFT